MKTVTLPLDKLIPYAGNPRKNDHAVEAVASAIKRFGFRVPVLAKSDGSLIDGHLRVKAAKHLGMEEVPVVLCDDLSEADIKALRISINRMAELADWDSELLSAELEGLAAEGFTLEDVGFDAAALEELGADLGLEEKPEVDAEPQIDKAEELRAKWGVEPGQLWELGDHRLLCGDSTKKEDVERVMGGDKPCASWADPPFEKDYKSRGAKGDCVKSESWQTILKATADNRCPAWFVKIPWTALCESIEKLNPNHLIVWAKQGFGMGGRDFRPQHEMICYGRNGGKCNAGADVGDVWTFPVPFRGRMLHVAETPVALISKAVGYVTDAGDVVFDPFSGSGTTIIACEQLGRKCRAIEISPAYVAVALQRWADATGKTPKLVA